MTRNGISEYVAGSAFIRHVILPTMRGKYEGPVLLYQCYLTYHEQSDLPGENDEV
jgi:hypothetical protein